MYEGDTRDTSLVSEKDMLFSHFLFWGRKVHMLCACCSVKTQWIGMPMTLLCLLKVCGFVLVKSGGDTSEFWFKTVQGFVSLGLFPSPVASPRFVSYFELLSQSRRKESWLGRHFHPSNRRCLTTLWTQCAWTSLLLRQLTKPLNDTTVLPATKLFKKDQNASSLKTKVAFEH